MVSKFLKPNKIQISLGFYTMSVIVLLKDGHKYEPEYRWIYLTFLHIHCAIKKKKIWPQKICPKRQIYEDSYSSIIQYHFGKLALELKYLFLF